MKRFRLPRPVDPQLRERLVSIDPVRGKSLAKNLEQSLMAIPLVAHEALTTAYINDVDGYGVFEQQLLAGGSPGRFAIDILRYTWNDLLHKLLPS